MNDKPEKKENQVKLAIQHYKFVSKEFTEYFRMYMQSWSIVGSVIIVGVIFGLKNAQTISNNTTFLGILICVTPLLILLCFILTAWFWGYFSMYRKYLRGVENIMITELDKLNGNILLFHSYRETWFKNYVQYFAFAVAIVLGMCIYAGLVIGASQSLVKMFKSINLQMSATIYIILGILSLGAAIPLIFRIKSYQQYLDEIRNSQKALQEKSIG